MKYIEYRFFVRALSLEFYLGLVAVLFTIVGIWVGLKLTRKKTIVVAAPAGELPVDEEGVVVNYPHMFRRVKGIADPESAK